MSAPWRSASGQAGVTGRPTDPWAVWAFVRAGAAATAPGAVATSGGSAFPFVGGGVEASKGSLFGMVRLSYGDAWSGDVVRDQALLAGARSGGEHLFVAGAGGIARATPVHVTDAGSTVGTTQAALAYDLSAHAGFGFANVSLAISGLLGPQKTSYAGLSIGAELGLFGF